MGHETLQSSASEISVTLENPDIVDMITLRSNGKPNLVIVDGGLTGDDAERYTKLLASAKIGGQCPPYGRPAAPVFLGLTKQ